MFHSKVTNQHKNHTKKETLNIFETNIKNWNLTFDLAEKYSINFPDSIGKINEQNKLTKYNSLSPLFLSNLKEKEILELMPLLSWDQIIELYNR